MTSTIRWTATYSTNGGPSVSTGNAIARSSTLGITVEEAQAINTDTADG